ncbi:glycosyltransferase family 2 protein [Pelagicoccus sp. NFK12]|uniref:Glycosyltransferase family 2 protein n=1 Tax=Pelagicoccus enzymogenes TaxID=2773457 RepID=A0A927F9Y5_9BACT|nr:glycosyltransferase family A protein [Pelagicoccus enzymogenes]MBD5781072.1 glycosyltransferase family 2 protein [Pelagicoccus enzymogenes]
MSDKKSAISHRSSEQSSAPITDSSRRSETKTDPKHSKSYVLVTPVRNEEKYIEETLKSVTSQTILPQEWVIVSDGSTDRTNEIIQKYLSEFSWIKLIQLPQREFPSFAAVVENTTLGINSLETKDYQFLGLLDSDLRFEPEYFEKLMIEFEKDLKLGLAGGVAIDIGLSKDVLPRNKNDVPGALQFFRRVCFEDIGGLVPIPEGGWDSITCTTARMKGYKTRLITHLIVDHLKPRNSIHGGNLKRKWQMGERDYALGYHPIFEIVKCISRLFRERPIVIGSIAWLLGFTKATIIGKPRKISKKLIQQTRRDQTKRLLSR